MRIANSLQRHQHRLRTHFFIREALQIFNSIDLVADGSLPFSIDENSSYRNHVRYELISRMILTRYMGKLTRQGGNKITKTLPESFSLTLNGWIIGCTHFVSCFASSTLDNENGFVTTLFCSSSFENESSQNVQHHYDYIEFLSIYLIIVSQCHRIHR